MRVHRFSVEGFPDGGNSSNRWKTCHVNVVYHATHFQSVLMQTTRGRPPQHHTPGRRCRDNQTNIPTLPQPPDPNLTKPTSDKPRQKAGWTTSSRHPLEATRIAFLFWILVSQWDFFAFHVVHSRNANSPLSCWGYHVTLGACIMPPLTLDGDISLARMKQPINSLKTVIFMLCSSSFWFYLGSYISWDMVSSLLSYCIIECNGLYAVHLCSRLFKVGPDPTNNGDLFWQKMSMHEWWIGLAYLMICCCFFFGQQR